MRTEVDLTKGKEAEERMKMQLRVFLKVHFLRYYTLPFPHFMSRRSLLVSHLMVKYLVPGPPPLEVMLGNSSS